MILLFLTAFSCVAHKTSLSGVIDRIGTETCTVELSTSEIILIESRVCRSASEGDVIDFYAKKNIKR